MNYLRMLKAGLKEALAWVLYVTGVVQLLVSHRLKHRAVVLMYHRVVERGALETCFSHPGIIVHAESFERQMEYLHRHFNVVSAQEFQRRLIDGRGFAPRTCLITFDDGWEDNYTQALPVLRKYNLPALVFLATGFVGSRRRFWQEELTHACWNVWGESRQAAEHATEGLSAQIGAIVRDLPPGAAGKALIQERVCELKHRPAAERLAALREFVDRSDVRDRLTAHVDSFVCWEQVREMAARGIAFGSHTVNHELLSGLGAANVTYEVRESKHKIEQELEMPVAAFSYPNGDHDETTCHLVASQGYFMAFTTEPGYVDAGDDRYRIRRINIHQGSSASVPMFMARIAGVL